MTWADDSEVMRVLRAFNRTGAMLDEVNRSVGNAMLYVRATRPPSGETAGVVVWWPGIGRGAIDPTRDVSGPLPSGGGFRRRLVNALAGYPARGSTLADLTPPPTVDARGWRFGDFLEPYNRAEFPDVNDAWLLLPHIGGDITSGRQLRAESERAAWRAAYVNTFQKLANVVLVGATPADFYFWAPLGELAARINSFDARECHAVRGRGAGVAETIVDGAA